MLCKLLREQCFSVLLYIMLCKLVHANDSQTIQTKTTEEYFSVVQFILLRKVVQTIYSVVQMLKCYAGEQYFLVNVVLFFNMLYKVAVASTKMSKLNPTVTI